MAIRFTLEASDASARAGLLDTPHGAIRTPAFMPVATYGVVKTLTPDEVRACGAQVVLSNAYHLALRPGVDRVQRLGGVHRFLGWDGPVLTDSGGFQGYSLAQFRRISEEGIAFRSHLDGSSHFLSPEEAVRHQEELGSDIAMVLDVCAPAEADEEAQRQAMERTARWAVRCRSAHSRDDQALFGIVQGGIHEELRQESARLTTALDLPGYAIGGLSVGESKEEMYRLTGFTSALLPCDRPRYLMGVGSPEDLVECVARGIDLFDCVLPTRVARNGALFTRGGRVKIELARYQEEIGPVEEGCDCFTCQRFSAAYLHHLFRCREMLGYRLATLHNLRFVLRLMEELRQAIAEGGFEAYRSAFLATYRPTSEDARQRQRKKWLEARRGIGLQD